MRYRGRLADLREPMLRSAREKARAHVTFAGGACISVRLRASGRLRLFIFRREGPTSIDWRKKFRDEVRTFLRYLGIEDWAEIRIPDDLEPEDGTPPVQVAGFDEPAP